MAKLYLILELNWKKCSDKWTEASYKYIDR
jgi:hypothetical protein